MTITMIGLDTAKAIFQVHGVDESGRAALKRKLHRSELVAFFEQQPRCTVFLEACGAGHPYRPAVAGRFRCADRIVGSANDGRAC
jgi:transposase